MTEYYVINFIPSGSKLAGPKELNYIGDRNQDSLAGVKPYQYPEYKIDCTGFRVGKYFFANNILPFEIIAPGLFVNKSIIQELSTFNLSEHRVFSLFHTNIEKHFNFLMFGTSLERSSLINYDQSSFFLKASWPNETDGELGFIGTDKELQSEIKNQALIAGRTVFPKDELILSKKNGEPIDLLYVEFLASIVVSERVASFFENDSSVEVRPVGFDLVWI